MELEEYCFEMSVKVSTAFLDENYVPMNLVPSFPKTLASHLELKDPRIDWLINLLQDIGKKVLVICAPQKQLSIWKNV